MRDEVWVIWENIQKLGVATVGVAEILSSVVDPEDFKSNNLVFRSNIIFFWEQIEEYVLLSLDILHSAQIGHCNLCVFFDRLILSLHLN